MKKPPFEYVTPCCKGPIVIVNSKDLCKKCHADVRQDRIQKLKTYYLEAPKK